MFALMHMSKVVLTLSVLVEMVDSVGDREHQGFLDTSLELTLFWGWEFQLREQSKFSALDNDKRIP